MGFLSACSLEQAPQKSGVRIQIDPTALRRDFSRALNHESAETKSYFLINVEGPGIPGVELPRLRCVNLGIGTSVLVAANSISGGSSDLPIELMVPAGLERRIRLYEFEITAHALASLPASGASATQYFSNPPGKVLAQYLRFHGETLLPDLFSEQTVVLTKVAAPELSFCPYEGIKPPVLSGAGLTFRNYRPFRSAGANYYVPTQSGPLLLWAPPADADLFLHVTGDLMSREGVLGTDMMAQDLGILSEPNVTLPPVSELTPAKVVMSDFARVEAIYAVPAPHQEGAGTFQHSVGPIKRAVPFEISLGNPLKSDPLNAFKAGEAENLFYVDIVPLDGLSALIRPVARDAIFGWEGTEVARIEIVAPPHPEVSPTLSPCPLEGLDSSPLRLRSHGCRLYFAVLNSTEEAKLNIDLEVAGDSGLVPVFRQAQLSIINKTFFQESEEFAFLDRPEGSEVSDGAGQFALNYPGSHPFDNGMNLISWEISGPDFKYTGNGSDQFSLVSVVSGQSFSVTKPLNAQGGAFLCVTRVSVLLEGGVNIPVRSFFRRDTFLLPPCGTPDQPSGLLAEMEERVIGNYTPVRISWLKGAPGLEYVIDRSLTPSGGDPTAYDTIKTCHPQDNPPSCEVSDTRVSFSDETAVPGVLYSYRVRAKDRASNLSSASSVEARILPIGSVSLSNPQLFYNDTSPVLSLSWSGAVGASSFRVQMRAMDILPWLDASTLITGDIFSFDDAILIPGTAYQFRVLASNSSGTNGSGDTRISPVVSGTLMDRPAIFGVCLLQASSKLQINFDRVREAGAPVDFIGVRGATEVEVLKSNGTQYEPWPIGGSMQTCPPNLCANARVDWTGLGSATVTSIKVRIKNLAGHLDSEVFSFSNLPNCSAF